MNELELLQVMYEWEPLIELTHEDRAENRVRLDTMEWFRLQCEANGWTSDAQRLRGKIDEWRHLGVHGRRQAAAKATSAQNVRGSLVHAVAYTQLRKEGSHDGAASADDARAELASAAE